MYFSHVSRTLWHQLFRVFFLPGMMPLELADHSAVVSEQHFLQKVIGRVIAAELTRVATERRGSQTTSQWQIVQKPRSTVSQDSRRVTPAQFQGIQHQPLDQSTDLRSQGFHKASRPQQPRAAVIRGAWAVEEHRIGEEESPLANPVASL